MDSHRRFSTLALILGVAFGAPAQSVTIDWISVGDPGNACDVQPQGCFGAVANTYRISKYETTNAQYTEFLNAVAVTDPNGLYNTQMGVPHGGITRSGSSGSFTYSAIPGREDMPVNFVSFYDALRFANWLHNGQPTGPQGSGTTEDGAYTITPAGIAANSIARNSGATIFLPSEDEWYKAAYYDAVSSTYFDYPAGSNTQTTCATPGATANTANCNVAAGGLTAVGSYTGSASPYGTFDQGGNLWELNEAIIFDTERTVRGGSFVQSPTLLAASSFNNHGPTNEFFHVGFRVASLVPEPSTGLLVITGMLGLAGWRRRRPRS